jgi:hypothetical protein
MMEKRNEIERFLKILKQHLPALKKRYHVHSLDLFGSYVRQEQDMDSDLDILVTFSEPPSLLTFAALENHLSDLLNVNVDLVMQSALKPYIGQRILEEKIPV